MNPQIMYMTDRGYSLEDMRQYWKARAIGQPAWFALKLMRQSYTSRAKQREEKVITNLRFWQECAAA